MRFRFLLAVLVALGFIIPTQAQYTPWVYWTLLPQEQMTEIIGEASGETAWNTIVATGGYNRDRLSPEYRDTFFEAKYIYQQLKHYGLPGAEIVRFPGGQVWDGVKGELWEVKPLRQKLASYQDLRAMLVKGSRSADVTAELVWVGRGTKEEIDRVDVKGKIVVTEGYVGSVHNYACVQKNAVGVIAISMSRPDFDPLQIPWSRLGGGSGSEETKFAFYLPFREGLYLKNRLLNGQKITVHAVVETTQEPYEIQDVTCFIPGTDPKAGEIILSAHLFEGYTKQGANDNLSGSAAILEVARTLHTLIQRGRLPQPRRTIRFLWGPEFSGIGPWVKANKELMEKTLCNINLDMVGEWLSKNKAFMCLMRTTYGNPHYVNDVVENYYRFVGEGNRERVQNRRNFFKVPHRIVAPSGADEPFYYSIETHYGSSDHEVFNDWGVRVPGVMMIAWPDQWYHTSGDRTDKADPTQLKRAVVIAAASAYTIASADEAMAKKIAAEISANASRRLGHKLAVATAILEQSNKETFSEAYKLARAHITFALENELATLESVKELVNNPNSLRSYLNLLKQNVNRVGKANLDILEATMNQVAQERKLRPATITLSDLEKKAAKIVPHPTEKVKANGYRGYYEFIRKVTREQLARYPYNIRQIPSTRELQLLINGKRSALEIKQALDVQYQRHADLQAVLNYLHILKEAGLVEW